MQSKAEPSVMNVCTVQVAGVRSEERPAGIYRGCHGVIPSLLSLNHPALPGWTEKTTRALYDSFAY